MKMTMERARAITATKPHVSSNGRGKTLGIVIAVWRDDAGQLCISHEARGRSRTTLEPGTKAHKFFCRVHDRYIRVSL